MWVLNKINMRTIKCYNCICGEDFYEDDAECINCGAPVDQSKFKEEQVVEIREVGQTHEEEIPLINQ